MGYWTNTMERYKIRDRSTHPWANILKQSLAKVEPETLAELEASGELGAFLSVKVDSCMKEIRSMVESGMDREAAKEIAFESMLPSEPEAIESWEQEGGEQDAIDGFEKWIGNQNNAGSQSNMED